MIDSLKFIREVTPGSIVELGVYGAIATKLVSDLDSGEITEKEANDFILGFQEREKIDLVNYM
jgi:hypothetical protein